MFLYTLIVVLLSQVWMLPISHGQVQSQPDIVVETTALGGIKWNKITFESHNIIYPGPLFHINFEDNSYVNSAAGWRVRERESFSCQTFQLESTTIPGLGVNIELCPRPGEVRQRLTVTGKELRHQIKDVVFPMVNLLPDGSNVEQQYAHVPDSPGLQVMNPFQPTWRYNPNLDYPSGWVSYQMMGLVGDHYGSYVAIFGDDSYQKHLDAAGFGDFVQFSFAWKPPRLSGTFSHTLPGYGVLAFQKQGNWLTAAHAYRNRFRASSSKKQNLMVRSTGLDDLDYWITFGCLDLEVCVEEVNSYGQQIEAKGGVTWYNWYAAGFTDRNNPDFLPPRNGFSEALNGLQSIGGFQVFPYINAHLWGDQGLDYETRGKQCSVKDRQLRPLAWSEHALRMCSGSQPWRQRILEEMIAVMGYDVDGLYVDQLGAIPPYECFDASHGHPLGGGQWWVAEARELLRELTYRYPGKTFISEAMVDAYDDLLAGNLNYVAMQSKQLPMINVISHGRAAPIGRFHHGGPDDHRAFRMKLGRSFVDGDQLGWVYYQQLRNPKNLSLLKALAEKRSTIRSKLRAANRAWLPPDLMGQETVSADWHHYWRPTIVTLRKLQVSFWKAEGNEKILLAVNIGDSQAGLARLMDWFANQCTSVPESPPSLLDPGESLILSCF